ncbi:MAG: AraC family transcriptional regulator [Myxococcota bacterium]
MTTHLEQVQRGVDFVEANLDRTFPLGAVSRAAAMSHWHFQRMFRALTGETLMTYVRSRRLSRASVRLLETDARILDIALGAGFESQESFTRAFRRAYGVPPGQFRRLASRRLFPEKVKIDQAYLDHVARGVTREPVFEERERVAVVGLRTPFHGVDSDKNNVAAKIPALWDAFTERMDELEGDRDVYFGLITCETGSDALQYLACGDLVGRVPDAMVVDAVPAGTWAVFEHRGPPEGLDNTVNFVYSTWLPNNRSWRHSYGPDLEIYGPGWEPSGEGSVMHYAIPVCNAT